MSLSSSLSSTPQPPVSFHESKTVLFMSLFTSVSFNKYTLCILTPVQYCWYYQTNEKIRKNFWGHLNWQIMNIQMLQLFFNCIPRYGFPSSISRKSDSTITNVCLSVCLSVCYHPSSTFINLHSSFLHFATFKLFSLFVKQSRF